MISRIFPVACSVTPTPSPSSIRLSTLTTRTSTRATRPLPRIIRPLAHLPSTMLSFSNDTVKPSTDDTAQASGFSVDLASYNEEQVITYENLRYCHLSQNSHPLRPFDFLNTLSFSCFVKSFPLSSSLNLTNSIEIGSPHG
jgi:hypothetical protein